MGLLGRVILSYISNLIAFVVTAFIVPGFEITFSLPNYLWLVALFTLINLIIRPVVKFILTPLVILTLGLFTLVINAAMLWLLDFLSIHINIMGLLPLIYATLIISLVNIIINFSARSAYRKTS
jgi:putative membrane protein